jgi:hypothetical protein
MNCAIAALRFSQRWPILSKGCAAGRRAVLVLWVVMMAVTARADDAQLIEKPSPAAIHGLAERVFAQQAGYQPGDLVTQPPTMQLLKQLESKGWRVREKEELLKRVPKADDFLVRQLSDARGREFLRKIEKFPEGIDRVDRLSRLPQGEMSVNDLIRKVPNGADWIEALTTTRRGEIEGQRLSNSVDGRDFNEPTGRIYTLPELVKEIHDRLEPASLPGTRSTAPSAAVAR